MCFFFNDTATTEIYTLSLHDALPILGRSPDVDLGIWQPLGKLSRRRGVEEQAAKISLEDRKSTRLNSSHANISYAVFCLKKKKKQQYTHYDLHYIDISRNICMKYHLL